MDTRLNEVRLKLARKARALNLRAGGGLPPLTLLTDDMRPVDWVEAVRALPRGSAVIVRHRDAGARERLARALGPICAQRRLKLLIAGDAALAQRVRADGLHLAQGQVSWLPGVRALNRRWIVTCAAHDTGSVRQASRLRADAVFVAPVFATASHRGARTLGAVRFAALATSTRVAVHALGGIDANTIMRLGATPIAGVGVIGAWVRS
ncbi:MAG: thiamine phosphate synthase [Alphaproteobacteria bacterium]|nr:thiamine phosphate synthase [Alphaproteobacteria bacterium]